MRAAELSPIRESHYPVCLVLHAHVQSKLSVKRKKKKKTQWVRTKLSAIVICTRINKTSTVGSCGQKRKFSSIENHRNKCWRSFSEVKDVSLTPPHVVRCSRLKHPVLLSRCLVRDMQPCLTDVWTQSWTVVSGLISLSFRMKRFNSDDHVVTDQIIYLFIYFYQTNKI